jgi:phosphonate transport system substrate-binding protein
MSRLTRACVLLCLPLAVNAASVTGPAARGLHFGSVAMDIPAIMNARLTPLTAYLQESLGAPVRLQLSPDMPSAIDEVANCHVDIAYLTPVAYLRAREKGNVRLVAKTVTQGKSSFKLMIVVREDSPYRTVADLENRSFAFGDRAALLQRAVVVGAGIKLKDFGEYRFLGHYDNIVRGVLNGDFDAGILKDTMAYQWERRGIRILYGSPDLPPYNIVVCGKVADETYQRIRTAFLSLDARNPGHLRVIKALDPTYDGFSAASDDEYDVVRRLVQPFWRP